MSRRALERLRSALAPAALFVAAWSAAAALGYSMRIPWAQYPLLDRAALAEEPLRALLLLHAQPPILNALLAGVLRLAESLALPAEAVAGALYGLLGLAAALLLAKLGTAVTGRCALGLAAAALALVGPGFHFFATRFTYTFPTYVLLLALLALALAYLRRGGAADLAGFAGAAGALALLRTSFPLPFGLLMLGALLALRRAAGGRVELRSAALAAALLAALGLAWPVKNALVFGEFTATSWRGYNLARGTPVGSRTLQRYITRGEVPPRVDARIEALEGRVGPRGLEVVAAPRKSGGARNWNHLVLLETSPSLTRAALAWRLEHPGHWLAMALAQYPMWARATYADPYRGGVLRRDATGLQRAHARLHRALPFADLRPLAERVWPGLSEFSRLRGRPVPLTLFGLVLFPALCTGALVRLVRGRRALASEEALVALALLAVLWSLALPCLSDGQEGNRMRFTTSGAFLLVALYALAGAARRGATPARAGEADDRSEERGAA